MKTPKPLTTALPLLFALLLATCIGEDVVTPAENPADSLLGKRICMRLRESSGGPDTTLWLDGEKYRLRMSSGNYSRVYQPLRGRYEVTYCARYVSPESLADLVSSASVRISVYNFQTREGKGLSWALYRAPVGPEATYENTVWGKLRVKGDSTYYAWHVLPQEKVSFLSDYTAYSSKRELSEWDPGLPISWLPKKQRRLPEKEAHDELAGLVSLTIPLLDGWEMYDLEFIPAIGRPADANDGDLPVHVRKSLVTGKSSEEKICRGDGIPVLCFRLRRR